MPTKSSTDPRDSFVTRWLPWLIGGVMLLIYCAKLNHWINVFNIGPIAAACGWMWQPQLFSPLTFLVIQPFRLLPAALVPLALNVFSAICAALTLAVLARCVAILPHDRTEMERNRERNDFSFLTGWVAWIPPVVAVIFAGMQLPFWEHATSFTAESFNLLWFGIIIWQLLEYRLDEREGRLFLATVLYGVGIPENWALVGYFPLFLTMLIWLRRMDFFDATFLTRITLCGVGGLLMFLLLPLLAKVTNSHDLTFWQALKPALRSDWMVIRSIKEQAIRRGVALISLTSLFPLFFMALRWSSSFGDSSRVGAMLVNYFIHAVNAVIFGVLLWVSFDPPFSAHQLLQSQGINTPGLSFHYLTALCIGYYCGYFLLIFGKPPIPSRRNTKPDAVLPKSLLWLCPVIVTGTLVATAFAAVLLVYKNAPVISAVNSDAMEQYARAAAQNLPPNGAILLCDSDSTGQDVPLRTYLMQAELTREGREKNYPVVDTTALNWPAYHEYLHKHFPKVWPDTVTTNEIAAGAMNGLHIFGLLHQFALSNNLCYLNPSFGYYFEQFYQEPHGLVYAMKLLPEKTLLPPPLDKSLMAENEAFWLQVMQRSQATIERALAPVDPASLPNIIGWVMMHLHVSPEADPSALMVGTFYSRALNSYGVQVQRAGDLEKALTFFNDATTLNPDNRVAAENAKFNQLLRAHSPEVQRIHEVSFSQFGKSLFSPTPNQILGAYGPFDETSFCFENGLWLMQGHLMRQAVLPFTRVRQLAPNNLVARLSLGEIYVFNNQPDAALEAMHDPWTKPDQYALTEYNSTEIDVLTAAAYFQKNENAPAVALLEKEVNAHPDNDMLLVSAAQSLMRRGLYTNALHVINHKLERTPDDLEWVYGKGFASLQVGAYTDAVDAFSHVLRVQTNNPDAIYNRGFAYFQSGQLDAARIDFRRLQNTYTNAFQLAYALGEIGWRKHETNEAIHNYQIYVANAPTNSAELPTIRERLRDLKIPGGK